MLTEEKEQALIFQWRDANKSFIPELALLHASLNGLKMTKGQAAKARPQMLKGAPDMFLPVARKGYHGLFIELKREKGGTVSAYQKKVLYILNKEGYKAVVCRGHDEAIQTIMEYLT